jgi:transposase
MISIVNPDAAGIDIGAEELYVSVPPDRDEKPVRRFGTYTDDVHALAKWLMGCGIKTVAMESTGVYWIPVYVILQQYGLEVCLVNARHLKNVPGRKSDVKDCVWLMDLHILGLLRPSFIPEEGIIAMRSYLRHREALIEHRAVHVNHCQKSLTQMNVRLTEVVSDVTGVSGLNIMRAIANGETDASKLLAHRNKHCKATPEQFVKALTANYRKEHLFTLKQSLALYDAYSQQVVECDRQIEAHLADMKPAQDDEAGPGEGLGKSRKTNTHSKNAPDYDLRSALYRLTGVDLTEIDGLHASTAQVIVAEIGSDMSKWKTSKHFSSWLGLSPKNDITGGKVRKSRTLPGNRRASQAFKMGAQSLLKANCALGAQARQLRARLGAAQAVTAMAHKLARIVYSMLKYKTSFATASIEDYDKLQGERLRKSLERRAAKLNMKLVPV